MVATLKGFSFDGGRESAFAMLAAKVQPLSSEHAKAALATFSFDAGRDAALVALGRHEGVQLTDRNLVELAKLSAFDDGRLECVKVLSPRLIGAPDGAAAKALLAGFSFDGGRESAVKVMSARWLQLTVAEREQLLATFSFDSGRRAATHWLMK